MNYTIKNLNKLCQVLNGNELKIYFILVDNCDANAECKLSIRSIAQKYGLNHNTVQKGLKTLIEKGFIYKTKRIGIDGRNLTNLYKINF